MCKQPSHPHRTRKTLSKHTRHTRSQPGVGGTRTRRRTTTSTLHDIQSRVIPNIQKGHALHVGSSEESSSPTACTTNRTNVSLSITCDGKETNHPNITNKNTHGEPATFFDRGRECSSYLPRAIEFERDRVFGADMSVGAESNPFTQDQQKKRNKWNLLLRANLYSRQLLEVS